MRKHNRHRKTHHLKLSQIGSVVLIAAIILPWAWPAFVDLSNTQTATQIKHLEYSKRSLEDSLRRQVADWNQLIQPENLDEAVQQNGFQLAFAPPERSIIVRKNGRIEIPATLHASLEATRLAKAEKSKQRSLAATSANKPMTPTRRRR